MGTRGICKNLDSNKNEKFSSNFSDADGRDNLVNNTEDKLLNITKLHKVSSIENNIFEPQISLETLNEEVKFLREEQKAGQRAICNLKVEFPKIVRNEFNRCLKGGL